MRCRLHPPSTHRPRAGCTISLGEPARRPEAGIRAANRSSLSQSHMSPCGCHPPGMMAWQASITCQGHHRAQHLLTLIPGSQRMAKAGKFLFAHQPQLSLVPRASTSAQDPNTQSGQVRVWTGFDAGCSGFRTLRSPWQVTSELSIPGSASASPGENLGETLGAAPLLSGSKP